MEKITEEVWKSMREHSKSMVLIGATLFGCALLITGLLYGWIAFAIGCLLYLSGMMTGYAWLHKPISQAYTRMTGKKW